MAHYEQGDKVQQDVKDYLLYGGYFNDDNQFINHTNTVSNNIFERLNKAELYALMFCRMQRVLNMSKDKNILPLDRVLARRIMKIVVAFLFS